MVTVETEARGLTLLFTVSLTYTKRRNGTAGKRWNRCQTRFSLVKVVSSERFLPVSRQRFKLQERYLTRTPWQYLPPFDGTGLVHPLLDSWTPPPHVREQDPNRPHFPQRPSTWKYKNNEKNSKK